MIYLTKFYKDPKNLSSLYSEIFESKYDSKPNLTYYENNILFTIFQTIESVYRLYYVSGKDTTKISKDQYEGWDNFVFQFVLVLKYNYFIKKITYFHLFRKLYW